MPGRRPTTYAESTHASPWWIVRYAHLQRFEASVEMMRATRPRVLVDWGAGDGHVLQMLLERPDPPEVVIAYEPFEGMRDLLAAQPAAQAGRLQLAATPEEAEALLAGRPVDVLACLGVIEHLHLADRRPLYDFARRNLAADGSLVLGLPVEIGPAVLVKEAGRRLLKKRAPEYSTGALLARSIGRTRPDPARFDDDGSTGFIQMHRGFDHRYAIREVEEHGYQVAGRRRSPLRWAPAWLFNQELVVRARPVRLPGRS
jgi:hypothetical protein